MKEQERKAEEEKDKKETLSKGNTTPSGRTKHTDALKKVAPRKRLGSPSDASGTDTSRKKGKSKYSFQASQPTSLSVSGTPSVAPVSA